MRRVGITYRLGEKLAPYADAVRYVGLEAVPLSAPGPHRLDGLDGLLVSGGTDLDPALYGQAPQVELETPDGERDAMELELTLAALRADLPLLCICRGMQILNVALGGDLVQHLAATDLHRQRGVPDAHEVEAVEGSRLAEIAGALRFAVNSRHHQAVGRLGRDLLVTARSTDGVIEAMEVPGRKFVVAVQWHPEDRVPSRAPDTRLFEAFARVL